MGRVCGLAQSVPAVLSQMFWRPDTCSDFRLGKWGRGFWKQHACENADRHLGPPPLVVEVTEEDDATFLSLFLCVCLFVCSLCPGAGSVQLYGAAILLGFFSTIILLTWPHQAVQQVSCRMQCVRFVFNKLYFNVSILKKEQVFFFLSQDVSLALKLKC